MKHLNNYTTGNFDYFNNIVSKASTTMLNESMLFEKHDDAIDSIMNKFSRYSRNVITGNIVEGITDDVAFTIDEEFAARDLMVVMCNKFIESLNEESQHVNEQLNDLEQRIITEGLSDDIKAMKKELKDLASKIGDKIKEIKDFIVTIIKSAVKSIKEFAYALGEMFYKFGCSFKELIEKFQLLNVGNPEDQYLGYVQHLCSDKQKINAINQSEIYESDGKYDNVYAQAFDAKPQKAKHKFLKVVLQCCASYIVTMVIPAIVGFIPGINVAAGVVEVAAKLCWSVYSGQKLIRNFIKTVKSPEFKHKKKWQKIMTIGLFIVMLYFSANTFMKSLGNAAGVIDTIQKILDQGGSLSDALGACAPSGAVQNIVKGLNSILHSDTATKSIKGWEDGYKWMEQIASKYESAEVPEDNSLDIQGAKGRSVDDALKAGEFSKSGSSHGIWKDMHKIPHLLRDQIMKLSDGARLNCVLDGTWDANKEFFQKLVDKGVLTQDEFDAIVKSVHQGVNAAFNSAHPEAGSMFSAQLPAKAVKYCIDNNLTSHHINFAQGTGCTFVGWEPASAIKRVVTTVAHMLRHTNSSIAFAGIGGLAPKGDFIVRLGSSSTKNLLYKIEESREVTMGELKKLCTNTSKGYVAPSKNKKSGSKKESLEYEGDIIVEGDDETKSSVDMEPGTPMWEAMKNQLNAHYKKIDELLSSDGVKNDKKMCKELKKLKAQLGESVENYKCLVFYGRLLDDYNGKIDDKIKDDENEEKPNNTKPKTSKKKKDNGKSDKEKDPRDYYLGSADGAGDDGQVESYEYEDDNDFIYEGDEYTYSDDIDMIYEGIFDIFKRKKKNKDSDSEDSDKSSDDSDNSSDEKDDSKSDDKSDSKKENDLIPVFFINPLLMCAGDLAQSDKRTNNSRSFRKSAYYLKGMFSRLEFIECDGGISMDKLGDVFISIMRESFKACWNMCGIDKPCMPDENDKKKYVLVKGTKDEDNKKKRKDFGNFTNEEITSIMNGEKISKYLDTQFATARGGQYITKHNAKNEKGQEDASLGENKNTEKLRKDITNLLVSNDRIKEWMGKHSHRKLRKAIYDTFDENGECKLKEKAGEELVDLLLTTNKVNFTEIDKKNIFGKIKSLFKKAEDPDDNSLLAKIDHDDLSKLVYLIRELILAGKKGSAKNEMLSDFWMYGDMMIIESNLMDLLDSYDMINE